MTCAESHHVGTLVEQKVGHLNSAVGHRHDEAAQVDPFEAANFETSFSLTSQAQGLKPGAYKLWVN
jgi:hypothetical protein